MGVSGSPRPSMFVVTRLPKGGSVNTNNMLAFPVGKVDAEFLPIKKPVAFLSARNAHLAAMQAAGATLFLYVALVYTNYRYRSPVPYTGFARCATFISLTVFAIQF